MNMDILGSDYLDANKYTKYTDEQIQLLNSELDNFSYPCRICPYDCTNNTSCTHKQKWMSVREQMEKLHCDTEAHLLLEIKNHLKDIEKLKNHLPHHLVKTCFAHLMNELLEDKSGVKKVQVEYKSEGIIADYDFSFNVQAPKTEEIFIVLNDDGKVIHQCKSQEEANSVYYKYLANRFTEPTWKKK